MKILMNSILFLRNNSRAFNLSAIERVVLLSIAGRTFGNNKETWIKQDSLADECLISIRYLQSILAKLLSKGLLKIKSIITKKGRQNSYQLDQSITKYKKNQPVDNSEATRTTDRVVVGGSRTTDRDGSRTTDRVPPDEIPPISLAAVGVQDINVGVKREILNKKTKAINNNQEEDAITLPDFIAPEDWQDFKAYRQKETKKPLGIIGQKRAISTLTKLFNIGQNVHDVIEQSITSGWSGLFPVRSGYATGQGNSGLNARQASLKRGWDAAFACTKGAEVYVPAEF